MIIDCISDLHGHYPQLEGGDLLIIAGDLTGNESLPQINTLKDWMFEIGTKYYKKIIMISGNHDNWIQKGEFFNRDRSVWEHPIHSYLEDSGTEFEGLKIWGSPWTQWFDGINPKCTAFMLPSEKELAEKFALIPDETDILITHSPPWEVLDLVVCGDKMVSVGSKALLGALERVKPKLHVFGHIHEAGGRYILYLHEGSQIICVNASLLNENYKMVNKPVRIKL